VREVKVSTSTCLFSSPGEVNRRISRFWDRVSPLWHDLWGPHIHHGYYEGQEVLSPVEAQERLVEKLVDLAGLAAGKKILDAGCGMGASTIYLARRFQADVTGISLSRQQIAIADEKAKALPPGQVRFLVQDALALNSMSDGYFDVVWSLESCEQFFDKPLFFQQAHRVLRPGGKLILATWCSGKEQLQGKTARDYVRLCRVFDLPYMPTMKFYLRALRAEGFELEVIEDWSENVATSWTAGISFSKKLSAIRLLAKGGLRALTFIRHLKIMEEGYKNGAVKYGVFLARKKMTAS
jgi:tocopherol O-methyltransferase